LKNTDIAKELCLPPVKLHCSSKIIIATKWLEQICSVNVPIMFTVLAEDAIRAALSDYRVKQKKN
jgi:iron-sulfur cluster assembly enzyme ISCU, mitochondrial